MPKTSYSYLRISIMMLVALTVLLTPHPAVHAAEEVVNSLEFDDPSPVFLYVAETTRQLRLYATIDGVAGKRDVTSDATWVSSNPSAVKVDKGLLTPLSKGTAIITAKYKNKELSIQAEAAYLYKELQLSETEKLQVELGDPQPEIKAFAVKDNNDSEDVTAKAEWTSSNSNVVKVSAGKLTLIGKGTATITAKYEGLSDSVEVEVSSPYSSIAIVPGGTLELMVGQEAEPLQAEATLKNGAKETVTDKANWTSSNPGVVKVDKGKLEPVGLGTATVSVEHLGVSTEMTVLVRLPYQVLLLTPKEEQHLFLNDAPIWIKGEVANDASFRQDVTYVIEWESSNPLVATVQYGVVTPKAVGTTTITARFKGLTKQIKVTVHQNLADLVIGEEELTLFKGEVRNVPKVTGTAIDEEEYDLTSLVEWVSSDDGIVKVENGKLTAVKPGTAVVTAKMKNFSDTMTVKVHEKVLALHPSKRSYHLVVDQMADLPKVKAVYEDGTMVEDLTGIIQWEASSPNLLIADGKMRALLGGRVSLTGKYLNKTITIPVAIEEQIAELIVEPESLELNPGNSKSLKVVGYYSDETKVTLSSKIEWTSSNPDVAAVKGYNVKAIAEGTATLTGSYQDKELKVEVRVVPKLSKLYSDETSYKLSVGAEKSLQVTALYANGVAVDVTKDAVWTSSNLSIVSVEQGRIKALKKGNALIKASFGKKTITFRVQVN